MTNQVNKLLKVIIIVVSTVILAALTYNYFHNSLQNEARLDFNNRARLIKTYLNLLGSHVNSFKRDIEYSYHLESNNSAIHPGLQQLKNFDKNHYILSNDFDSNDSENNLQVTLSGIGTADKALQLHGKEINTILKFSSRFNSIAESLPEITWVYYTSINKFLFVAPTINPDEYLFDEPDYQRNFWQEAQPENNPEHKQIITKLYNDAAGQGLMVTISSPVLLDNHFMGIVSLDLGLDFLRSLLISDLNSPLGESILVDESSFLVGKVEDFTIGTQIEVPDLSKNTQGFIHTDDKHWLITELVDGELWLVHVFENNKIIMASLIKSIPVWTILFITLALAFVLIKLQEVHKQIVELSRIDPLTGLLNRRGLYESIKQPVSFSKRHNNSWSVVIMDIDYFKKVNDTYGHNIGDEVIQEVGRLMKDIIRNSDIAARWGGEEFLLFLPDTNAQMACHIADKLLEAVSTQQITNNKLNITLSSGCAEAKADEPFDEVLKRADIKLYEAKEKGRNQNQR